MNGGSAVANERDQASETIVRRGNFDHTAWVKAQPDEAGDEREKTAFVGGVVGKIDEDVALA